MTPDGLPETLAAVLDLADPSVDQALAAALPTATPDERPALIEAIAQRGDLHAMVRVVEHYHEYDDSLREFVDRQADEHLDGPIRTLIARQHGQGCRNALELIRQRRLTRLAYLVTELVRHGQNDLAQAAAAVLAELAGLPDLSPTQRDAMRQAVDAAVARYDRHHHPPVLDAFLALLPGDMPAALDALKNPSHPAAEALAVRLTQAQHALDRHALLPLLPAPSLTLPALRGLAAAADAGFLGEALHPSHLLHDPRVRHALTRMQNPDPVLLKPDARRRVPPPQRCALPRFYAALPITPGRLIAELQAMHDDPNPSTRTAALCELTKIDRHPLDPGTARRLDDAVSRFAHDAHEPIARLAVRYLDRRFSTDTRDGEGTNAAARLAPLAGSPHEAVRHAAGQRLGPIAFDKLWKTWDKLPTDRRTPAINALHKLDTQLDDRLKHRLRDDARSQVRALSMVRHLGVPASLEAAVGKLVKAKEARVAASAAAALGEARSDIATGQLEAAMQHDDPRVRANAVEALEKLHAAEAVRDKLLAMAKDDAHRPRASAIKALSEVTATDAFHALADMLRDTRPQHRRSALWLVKSTGLLDVANCVADLPLDDQDDAFTDPDHAARHADAVLHQLLGELLDGPDDDNEVAA